MLNLRLQSFREVPNLIRLTKPCFLTDPIVVGDEECEVLQMLPRALPPTLLRDDCAEKVQGESLGEGVQESAALHFEAKQGRNLML